MHAKCIQLCFVQLSYKEKCHNLSNLCESVLTIKTEVSHPSNKAKFVLDFVLQIVGLAQSLLLDDVNYCRRGCLDTKMSLKTSYKIANLKGKHKKNLGFWCNKDTRLVILPIQKVPNL